MAGKYTPLENYLHDLPARQREITLGFEQIERILNDKLPSSAYEDRRWWDHEKEGNHVNARAWANAGWKIENVDFGKKCVRFVLGNLKSREGDNMKEKTPTTIVDGAQCKVIRGVHAGKSGTVRDIKTGKTGYVSITVVQSNGERFKTLAKNVVVLQT